MNWYDRALRRWAPKRYVQRQRARELGDAYGKAGQVTKRYGAYQGASTSRRKKDWTPTRADAPTVAEMDLARLRARSRDLRRNNAYINRGLSAITHNTVGAGIVPRIRSEGSQRARNALQDLWRKWAETRACDADGRHNLYGLQSLVMDTVAESGECLIRRRMRRPSDGVPLNFQLEVLEPDFIATNVFKASEVPPRNSVVNGIEFDSVGRRVAYHLYSKHPGRQLGHVGTLWDVKRVPAEEMIHVYRVDRPGQVRGIPWTASVMIRMHDLDEYQDAQLNKQKVAACFAAFIHGDSGDELSEDEKEVAEKLEPAMIERLASGEEVSFGNPPTVGDYSEHVKMELRAVAQGLGVTYQQLTGDLSSVNFSSGKMGWMEHERSLEAWRWQMLIPVMCGGVWQWFTEMAELFAGVSTRNVSVGWTPPQRTMIDPTKEIPAERDAIRSGQMTLFEALRRRGHDPREALSEYQEANELLDSLGIVLDSDPRHTTSSGNRVEDVQDEDEDPANAGT